MFYDLSDIVKLLVIPTICIIIYTLLNKCIPFRKNGYIYNSFYNNLLFKEKKHIKAIFVSIFIIIFFTRLYILMDQHFVYMLGFGSGGGGMNPNGSNSNFNPNPNFRPNGGSSLNMATSKLQPKEENQSPFSLFPILDKQLLYPKMHNITAAEKALIFNKPI
jgi:hypothetical protein